MAKKYAILLGAAAIAATSGWANAKTVCYVTAADAHPYVTPANEAIDTRAKELGIEVIRLSQNFDVQTGTEQMNTCIARGVSRSGALSERSCNRCSARLVNIRYGSTGVLVTKSSISTPMYASSRPSTNTLSPSANRAALTPATNPCAAASS